MTAEQPQDRVAELILRKRRRLRGYRRLAALLAHTPYEGLVRAIVADETRHVRALERAATPLRPPSRMLGALPARPRLRLEYVLTERLGLSDGVSGGRPPGL